jgi:hypothetical protein
MNPGAGTVKAMGDGRRPDDKVDLDEREQAVRVFRRIIRRWTQKS